MAQNMTSIRAHAATITMRVSLLLLSSVMVVDTKFRSPMMARGQVCSDEKIL
jgi:hypothetical protein